MIKRLVNDLIYEDDDLDFDVKINKVVYAHEPDVTHYYVWMGNKMLSFFAFEKAKERLLELGVWNEKALTKEFDS